MKKLFPEVTDVPQHVANRASRIIEKHFRIHHVSRARDLPEEARIRLYRDLRFFFESGSPPPSMDSGRKGFSISGFFSRLWEKMEDFLSASEADPALSGVIVMAWASLGEPARFAIVPWCGRRASCEGCC